MVSFASVPNGSCFINDLQFWVRVHNPESQSSLPRCQSCRKLLRRLHSQRPGAGSAAEAKAEGPCAGGRRTPGRRPDGRELYSPPVRLSSVTWTIFPVGGGPGPGSSRGLDSLPRPRFLGRAQPFELQCFHVFTCTLRRSSCGDSLQPRNVQVAHMHDPGLIPKGLFDGLAHRGVSVC